MKMAWNIFIYLVILYTVAQASDDDKYDECVKGVWHKSSYVAHRHSYEKTAWMCERIDEWQTTIKSPSFSPSRIFTSAQIGYLQHVRTCNSFADCLPNVVAAAREKRESFDPRVVRKEYRTLTEEERATFHFALNVLKTSMIDGMSKYDLLITDHLPTNSPEAHWGCAFIPFHRELLKQMEVAMRLEKPKVFIPYWDSSLDQGLPTPCDSVLWTDEFTGNGNGLVKIGPFRNWRTTVSAPGKNDRKLYRNCGASSAGELYDPKDFDYYNSKSEYYELFCNCNDATFEMNHGLVHEYIGGHMLKISISPNDPIFFQHHTFVDYLYEEFRVRNYNDSTDTASFYPPDGDLACSYEHYANATMRPFNHLRNIDGLSRSYTEEFYTYAPRPTCRQGCEGPYLFCDTKRKRCLSKVKLGGNCTGFEETDICAYGSCIKGLCRFK